MRRLGVFLVSLTACWMEGPSVQASSIRSLPVPVETIYPGQAIQTSQLMQRKFQTTANSLTGIATDASEIAGKESRRRLPAGKPIPLSVLQAPLAIRRGSTAVAAYDDTGLSISTPVTILEDGVAGDVIDARNMATGAVIQVEVLTDGGVRVIAE